jgi:hypothetical protein
MARENASHAPGSEVTDNNHIRQRAMMGQGDGPMKGETFGVGPLPGTRHLPSMGDHVAHDGLTMGDKNRAGPPPIDMGEGRMAATAHSRHGPHQHNYEAPNSSRGKKG